MNNKYRLSSTVYAREKEEEKIDLEKLHPVSNRTASAGYFVSLQGGGKRRCGGHAC